MVSNYYFRETKRRRKKERNKKRKRNNCLDAIKFGNNDNYYSNYYSEIIKKIDIKKR